MWGFRAAAAASLFLSEILQFPEQKRIVIIFEGGAHIWREIHMDGRPHPPLDRPWTFPWDIPWRAGQELQEYICQENNQYMRRLNDDFGEPIFYDPRQSKK